jgi:hypothetical protein
MRLQDIADRILWLEDGRLRDHAPDAPEERGATL